MCVIYVVKFEREEDSTDRVVCVLQGKLQKHQAFEAEVVANKERIFSAIAMGQS